MRWTAIAAPALLTASLHAQSIVLDDFAADVNGQAGGPSEVSSVINANPFSQSSDFGVFAGFSFGDIDGAAIFNSGIGVQQTGAINWDANGAGLDLDASALGVVGFELDFLQIDQEFTIEIVLETFGFNPEAAAVFSTTIGPAMELTTYAVPAGAFTTGEGSGFSFSKVDSVTITFNPADGNTPSLDFILTEFRAVVPTPASAALLGLGGLVATRRRR